MRCLLKLILLLLIIAPGIGVKGQANFREGRVITIEGDTLTGLIKDGFTPRNSRLCLFKQSRNANVVRYHPEDLRSFKIGEDKYYAAKVVSVKGKPERVFTEVLLEGDINLYHQRTDKEYSYYMEKDEGALIGLVNRDREYERESNWVYRGFSTYEEAKIPEFRDTLYNLFEDSKEVQRQVYKVRYNNKSFLDITKSYVEETCQGNECISFERELSRNRERFGAFTGLHLSKAYFEDGGAESNVNTTVPFGIFYHIPLSFIHDRLSFQNEVILRRLQYDEVYNAPNETIYSKLKWDVVGIPLLLQYRISVKRFSPTIGFGKEFGIVVNSDIVALTEGKEVYEDPVVTSYEYIYRLQKGGWFVDLGMDYNVNRRFSLFSNIRIQYYQNKVTSYHYEDQFTFKVAEGTALESFSAALHVGVRF